ncbi:hypothetical protein AAFF_G00135870 [Aldrovandia affinis]|uniref:Uncharacterized protein n=1 Tax=Aldrovandia affinis TaxID=143900 RepID=A0AAD7RPU8_9TELE|nr:hypothetical protein AAFF_G00135870 [Aldrovandia affinis]
MSEEAKDKSTGKPAHRKKKGKKPSAHKQILLARCGVSHVGGTAVTRCSRTCSLHLFRHGNCLPRINRA